MCTLESDTSELRAQCLHLLTMLAVWPGAGYISKPQSSVFSSIKWDERTYPKELCQGLRSPTYYAFLLPYWCVCVWVVSDVAHILHFPVHLMPPSRSGILCRPQKPLFHFVSSLETLSAFFRKINSIRSCPWLNTLFPAPPPCWPGWKQSICTLPHSVGNSRG